MKYVVTGGSGFLGKALLRHLAGSKITVIARNEANLLELEQNFADARIWPADIGNACAIQGAFEGVHTVYHLAAFKHVGLAEEHPRQCINTNVLGTINVLNAAVAADAKKVVGVSSDKAATPTGVYGMTKALQESLFSECGQHNPTCKFYTVRFGNIFHSTGSVLDRWKKQVSAGLPVTVTDMEATRFFWTVEEAVDALLNIETMAPKPMRAVRIGDLLGAATLKYRWDPKARTLIGLQPGENLHERLVPGGPSSADARRYTLDELMEIV